MYKQDLALYNLQWLVYYKTQPTIPKDALMNLHKICKYEYAMYVIPLPLSLK